MNFIKCILQLQLLIILTFNAAAKTVPKPPPPPPMRIVCAVDTGTRTINLLPDECTAVAKYASCGRTEESDIQILRRPRSLPYYYVVDNYSYRDLRFKLKPDEVQSFIDEINNLITDNAIDVVIFDNMFSGKTNEELDYDVQIGIKALFTKVKENNKDVLLALVLPKDELQLRTAFDAEYVMGFVDFFVADTYSYQDCRYKFRRSHMPIVAKPEEMELTIKVIVGAGYPYNKLMYMIRVLVQSTLWMKAREHRDESYSDICADDHKRHFRRFCADDLESFFKKGTYAHVNHMRGVILRSVDRDDFKGTCTAGVFPVMKVVTAAVLGKPEPTELTENTNFGRIIRFQHRDDGDDESGDEDGEKHHKHHWL